MFEFLSLVFLPHSDTATIFSIVVFGLFALGLVRASLFLMGNMKLAKSLQHAEGIRSIPLSKSPEEFHQEALQHVGRDGLLGTLLEHLLKVARLKGSAPSSAIVGGLLPSAHHAALRVVPVMLLATGFIGMLISLMAEAPASIAKSSALASLAVSAPVIASLFQIPLWSTLCAALLAALISFSEHLARSNKKAVLSLFAAELNPRYFRDTAAEQAQTLLKWAEELFHHLSDTANCFETAVRQISSAAELLHNSGKTVQIEKEKLTFVADSFKESTDKLLAYKDQIAEVFQRFVAIDTQIFENHHHFNDRVAELYEHLEKQNQLLMDLREDLGKHELARLDVIEEFLRRIDLVIREMRSIARSKDTEDLPVSDLAAAKGAAANPTIKKVAKLGLALRKEMAKSGDRSDSTIATPSPTGEIPESDE